MSTTPPKAATPPAEESTQPPAPSQSPRSQPGGDGEDDGDNAINLHTAQHWAQMAEEAPPPEDDNDSTLGEDAASSTASITSSILRYRTINGRTYHSERGNAQYWTPNDDNHTESMDMNHHLLSLCLKDRLFLAPLEKEKIKKVLDIGTGTGIWAIDFADEFPSAEVVGTDLSPIQPTWVPPNVTFEIDDCMEEWTFRPDSIDYVHMRYLYGSIKDWYDLLRQAYRVCKPGGWVESYEASPMMESDDGTVTETCAINEWGKFFIEGGKKLNRTFTILDEELQRKAMEEAGFVDIKVWDFKAPIGGWAKDERLKEIGQFAQAALEQDYEGYVMFMANTVLGWSKEEVSVYCANLRREIRSGKFHPYYRQRVVYGRKPE